MRSLDTRIDIDAAPDDVWATLVDVERYREWNPFITSIEGELRVGGRLRVRLQPPGGRGIVMRPVVQAVEARSRFGWLGHLLVPHAFDGAHEFVVEARGRGAATFVQREEFGGLLVPLFGRVLDRTLEGFEAMNAALKARVEEQARAHVA
jgi:hypothetical protein